MTRKEIVSIYCKNIYDIQLEIATALFISGDYTAAEAFAEAFDFIAYMESGEHQKLE